MKKVEQRCSLQLLLNLLQTDQSKSQKRWFLFGWTKGGSQAQHGQCVIHRLAVPEA